MYVRNFLLTASMCFALGAASFASAQSTNALIDPPTIAPTPLSPLDGSDVVNPVLPGNPTIEWTVVSNADQYRLWVMDGDGVVKRWVFDSNGTTVNDSSGNIVCESATTLGTVCTFPLSGVNLGDGEDFMWRIGARNTVTGGAYQNSDKQTVTYLFSATAPVALTESDHFVPRGNIRNDRARARTAVGGMIAFHWANNGDASSFRLEMRTIPENNLLDDVIIPLNDPDLSCTTVDGVFDACTYRHDPEARINFQANDFCWSITPINAIAPNGSASAAEACYAAL